MESLSSSPHDLSFTGSVEGMAYVGTNEETPSAPFTRAISHPLGLENTTEITFRYSNKHEEATQNLFKPVRTHFPPNQRRQCPN